MVRPNAEHAAGRNTAAKNSEAKERPARTAEGEGAPAPSPGSPPHYVLVLSPFAGGKRIAYPTALDLIDALARYCLVSQFEPFRVTGNSRAGYVVECM